MTRFSLSTRRSACMLALATGAALIAVPSAQAANMVPNPGFENSCPGAVPCQWTAEGGATFFVSVTQPHSGSASGLLTMATTGMVGASAQSDCLPVTAGTTYNMAIWYRAPSAVAASITRLAFTAFLWPNTDCTGGATDESAPGAFTNTPNKDGNWHAMTGTVTATSILFTPQSANLEIIFLCDNGCPLGQASWFDDAQMDTSPLAVTLYGFRATRSHGGVTLRWRTGTEADTLGFNVFRRQGARRVRVNRQLLPALGGLGGSSYSFVDRRAPRHRAVRYWLQDVDTHGVRTWHGPVRVRAA